MLIRFILYSNYSFVINSRLILLFSKGTSNIRCKHSKNMEGFLYLLIYLCF